MSNTAGNVMVRQWLSVRQH